MTDEDREEVENMIFNATLKVEEDVKSEMQDEIRRLEIEIENLRSDMESNNAPL